LVQRLTVLLFTYMTEDIKPCYCHHIGFAKYLLGLSVLIILGTVVASIFALEPFGSMCICIINFLAYAWIAFACTALLSMITFITVAVASSKEHCCQRFTMINVLLWLQGIAFLTGLIFLVIFIARYANVL
jgi:hypothetical protein